MSAPGLLHNLSQEITTSNDNENWYAYSSHRVAVEKPLQSERRQSGSASGSATPSPHKQRKRSPPRLQNWSIRLCQIFSKGKERNKDGDSDSDSETESDEDSSSAPSTLITAWYSTQFNATQASVLTKESGEVSWHTLELSIRVAWDKGSIDVMGAKEEKRKDGTYESIKGEEGQGSEKKKKKKVEILLQRLEGDQEVTAASLVTSELIKAYTTLKSRTHSLVEEREVHRKLLQNNRRHERIRERNSSLVNPGRLKRKIQDDEGFEGEEEEEAV